MASVLFRSIVVSTADEARLTYYASVKAKAGETLLRQPLLVLNPGCSTFPEAYMAFADIMVTYENSAEGYANFAPAPFTTKYPSSRFWHIIYSARATSADATLRLFQQQHANWLFLTDLDLDNPYKDLPAHEIWQQQLRFVQG